MPSYLSPGVYMEEVDKGTKPIESVGTAVAAFIGYTERAVDAKTGKSLVGKPTLVTNWSQYIQSFGAFVDGAYTPDSVYGYFNNGGSICYVVSVKTIGASADPDASEPKPLLILGLILLLGGIQFITIGIIADINTRTYFESQNKTRHDCTHFA